MPEKILVVEDHSDLLYSEVLLLELNGFDAIGAENGLDALSKLEQMDQLPDLIISDILMPKMSGYDFYQTLSRNPKYSKIPFIFLTAKSSPEDVRFAKYLGVDDYITKPFKEEKLIELIKEKLQEHTFRESFQHNFDEKSKSASKFLEDLHPHNTDSVFVYVKWDDLVGPKLDMLYPSDFKSPFSLEDIASQLFDISTGLYGQHKFQGASDVLLGISNISMDGYLYFDSMKDKSLRSGVQSFMLGLIAPKIHYLASLRLKEIFRKIAENIKSNLPIKIESNWNQISYLLSLSN
jgi:CheY-like chemotaxis protein